MRWVLICIHFIPKLSIFARNFIFQSETSNLPLLNSPVGSDQFLSVYVYTQIVGPFASNVVSLTCHHTSYIIILFSYILMFGFFSLKRFQKFIPAFFHFSFQPLVHFANWCRWTTLRLWTSFVRVDVHFCLRCSSPLAPAFIGGSEERVEGIAPLPPRKMNESTCSNHQFSWDKSL